MQLFFYDTPSWSKMAEVAELVLVGIRCFVVAKLYLKNRQFEKLLQEQIDQTAFRVEKWLLQSGTFLTTIIMYVKEAKNNDAFDFQNK